MTVIFERKKAGDRDDKWRSHEKVLYREIYLKSYTVKNESSISIDIIRYIKKLDYDMFIVHGYSTFTAMIAIEYLSYKKIPFVISADGGLVSKNNRIKEAIKRHYIGAASAWLSTGELTTEYFIKYGAKKEKIFAYPFTSVKNCELCIPSSIEEKNQLRKKLKIKEKKVVLFVGQLIFRKGIDILLDDARRLDSLGAGILLVGGVPNNELKKTVKEYGLDNVHFISFKEKGELQDYYRVADIFVLPTREDIWGLVVNEAMAQGVPIVSTNRCVAAMTMIENEKSGFIVKAEDSDELYEKMAVLLTDEQKRQEFADYSYKISFGYTIEKMAQAHIKIFGELYNLFSQKNRRRKQ